MILPILNVFWEQSEVNPSSSGKKSEYSMFYELNGMGEKTFEKQILLVHSLKGEIVHQTHKVGK